MLRNSCLPLALPTQDSTVAADWIHSH